MGTDDALSRLIADAYTAAIDDVSWDPWLQRLTDMLGAHCGALHVLGETAREPRRSIIRHRNPSVVDRYAAAGIAHLDPQISHAMSRPASCIYLDTDHVDHGHPGTAEFTAWMIANGGLHHHMSAVVLLGDGAGRVALSFHRAPADGHTPGREQRVLAAILPALSRALRLGFRHGDKLTEAFWAGLADNRGEPASLVGEDGAVIRSNDALRALLGRDGLRIAGGRLRADDPADDARLQATIGRAVARASPAAGALRIARRSGRAAYIVTAYPLPRTGRVLASCEPSALLTVVDPVAAPPSSTALWREAFDLTAREADMAASLMAGHSVESASAALGVAEPTARVHLRHLFAKTGTGRQAELVRLLARLG